MQRKEFREDLFYRLNVVRLNLPPLRERQSDVAPLVHYFINKFRLKQPTGPSQISEEAMAAMQRYHWPGNVRELENCVQRAMVLATGNTITMVNLPQEIAGTPRSLGEGGSTSAAGAGPVASGKDALARAVDSLFEFARRDPKLKLLPAAERELIVRALAETSGNQVQAAKLLGITRATLRKRVDKFGIQKRMAID